MGVSSLRAADLTRLFLCGGSQHRLEEASIHSIFALTMLCADTGYMSGSKPVLVCIRQGCAFLVDACIWLLCAFTRVGHWVQGCGSCCGLTPTLPLVDRCAVLQLGSLREWGCRDMSSMLEL